MIKAVFFDWSGTLCDDYEDFSKGVSRYLINYSIFRFIVFNRFSTSFRYYLTLTKLQILVWYPKNYRSVFKAYKFYPHVDEILKYLKRNKIKVGIISLQSPEVIRRALKSNNLDSCVDFIDGGMSHKGVLIANSIKKLDLKKHEVLFVTDTVEDIYEVGERAIICAVTGGYDSKQRLLKAKPDFLISSRRDIKKVVESYT